MKMFVMMPEQAADNVWVAGLKSRLSDDLQRNKTATVYRLEVPFVVDDSTDHCHQFVTTHRETALELCSLTPTTRRLMANWLELVFGQDGVEDMVLLSYYPEGSEGVRQKTFFVTCTTADENRFFTFSPAK